MLKKIFTKKNFSVSNIIFVLVVAMLLYPPSREWFQRQIAFAPSINSVEEAEKISSYNWELNGLNTTSLHFNELEGKIIFVNFWATWCPPCRAEMPMIQDFYNAYKDKVAFIFVTTENWSTVEKYFSENNYDIPVYNTVSTVPTSFSKTNSIPASYLIDKKGNILISKTGAANWNGDKVKTLIDKLLLE